MGHMYPIFSEYPQVIPDVYLLLASWDIPLAISCERGALQGRSTIRRALWGFVPVVYAQPSGGMSCGRSGCRDSRQEGDMLLVQR